MTKSVAIFGGGTIFHVASHLMIGAEAGGGTAKSLSAMLTRAGVENTLHLTKMAGGDMVTNDDVESRLREVLLNPNTAAVIFNVALCDVVASLEGQEPGKYAPRLESRQLPTTLTLHAAPKVLPIIKKLRPDVLVVGFKTTTNQSREIQIQKSLRQISETGVDYVVANDTGTRLNLLLNNTGTVLQEPDRSEVLDTLINQLTIRLKAA